MSQGQWIALSAGLLSWALAAGYAWWLLARLRRGGAAIPAEAETVPTVVVRDVLPPGGEE